MGVATIKEGDGGEMRKHKERAWEMEMERTRARARARRKGAKRNKRQVGDKDVVGAGGHSVERGK